MNITTIWEDQLPEKLLTNIKKNLHGDRFFLEITPAPSVYYYNKNMVLFPKIYRMNLTKEEITKNNIQLNKTNKSPFLTAFLKRSNISTMGISFEESSSYYTVENIPNAIIKETIALSANNGYLKNNVINTTLKQLCSRLLIKHKFKETTYYRILLEHYLSCVEQYGFKKANSKLSIFSLLNRITSNKNTHKLSLHDLFIEKSPSDVVFFLKDQFYHDYYLAENDFNTLSFPHYDYSEQLISLVFSEKERSTNKLFSLESYFSDDKNLYSAPIGTFTKARNIGNNDHIEILPRISNHFKQHLVFYQSTDFLSICTMYGRIQINKKDNYSVSSKISEEIKIIEKLMIELLQCNNVVNNDLFISKFIENSLFYKKFSSQYNSSKKYYEDYLTPVKVFKLILLSTVISVMNKSFSPIINDVIVETIKNDTNIFEDANVGNIIDIGKYYLETRGSVRFDLITNIIV